jgi:hypothetical protein
MEFVIKKSLRIKVLVKFTLENEEFKECFVKKLF